MRDKLLQLGFETLPHFTIGDTLIYKIHSKHNKLRILSITSFGTPNEMVSIGEMKSDIEYEDLTIISNYDYDGLISLERLESLLFGLTGKQPEVKSQPTWDDIRDAFDAGMRFMGEDKGSWKEFIDQLKQSKL